MFVNEKVFIRKVKKIFLKLIGFYQLAISPLLPPACRFHPCCSDYGKEAIEIHGALKGGLLTLWRLLRCQPFAKSGFDPVPEKQQIKFSKSEL